MELLLTRFNWTKFEILNGHMLITALAHSFTYFVFCFCFVSFYGIFNLFIQLVEKENSELRSAVLCLKTDLSLLSGRVE